MRARRAPDLAIWSGGASALAERPVRRLAAGAPDALVADHVVVEEPLEIRIGDDPLLVTMRTPGDDLDLALGLLFTEGVIRGADEVTAIAHAPSGPDTGNVVVVTPAPGRTLDVGSARRVLRASAACGVCGKETIAALRPRMSIVPAAPLTIDRAVIAALPRAIRVAQPVFEATGGLHGAGLFTREGLLVAAREDVGRHNAVDKVIGCQLRRGARFDGAPILMLSGRAGFELVQKAAVAGIPVVCAVSAPSSLAIALAEEAGITLIGFVRGDSMNVYSHPRRIT